MNKYLEYSLAGARKVDPDSVSMLQVSDFSGAEFPDEILAYRNLSILSIYGKRDSPIAILDVPEEIGELVQLTGLILHRTSIEQLPTCVFSLPNLENLSLSDNRIRSIPANIDLPKLESASFRGNQLTTLPRSLAMQPNLFSLGLEDNPWESLPSEFNRIKVIGLPVAERNRLLGPEYTGADNTGIVEWDDSAFFVRSDPPLQAKTLEAIKNSLYEKYTDVVEEQTLKAVCINPTTPDDYSRIGNTRFGGMPDLPQGEPYPTSANPCDRDDPYHCSFLAQINCEELAPFQEYLPRSGMLYFYAEEQDSFTSIVKYHPRTDDLQPAKALAGLAFNNSYIEEPYKPLLAKFGPMAALPQRLDGEPIYNLEGPEVLEALSHVEGKAFSESMGRIGVYREHNDVYYSSMHHSINGIAMDLGGDTPNERAAVERGGKPEDWMLLLRLFSDDKSGFQFYDAGELCFVIHKSDLARRDFSNVYSSAESS